MELFNAQTLEAEDLPETEAERAVLSGRYGFANAAKVVVRGEDGSAWEITGAEAPEALSKGFRLETPEQATERAKQAEYGDAELAALGLGAARGITAGASDAFATMPARQPAPFTNPFTGEQVQVGSSADLESQWQGADERKEALAEIRERNPVASGVGEVAGMVAGTLVGGTPASAASAAGRIVEGAAARAAAQGIAKRVVQKAIGKAAGSAVEAAYLSTGQMVTEEALGDTELTAERVISHVGISALLGGAVGGALSVGADAASMLAGKVSRVVHEKVGSRAISEMAEEFADESALKATGARGTDIRKLGTGAKVRQLGEDLRTVKLKDGRQVLEAGQSSDDFLDRIRQAEREYGKDLGDLRKRVDDYVRANPDEAWDFGEYLAKVRTEVLEPLMESGVPDIRARGKAVYRVLLPTQKAWEKGYKLPPSELEKLRSDMAKVVYPKAVKGQGVPPSPPAHADELHQAERILADWIESKTEGVVAKMAPNEVGKYAQIKRVYESMKKSDQIATKSDMQSLGNRWGSPTDYATGIGAGVLAGGPMGVVAGLAVAAGHKILRERGRSVVAVAAGKVAQLAAVERAAAGVAGKTAKAIESFVRRIENGAEQAAVATAARTPASSLETVSFDPAMKVAKRGRGEDADRRLAAFRARSAEIRYLAQNPKVVADRLAASIEGLGDVAPKIASQMTSRAALAVQFLDTKAPRNPLPMTPLGLNQDWQPSDSEIASWERYVAVAEDPMIVLDQLERGTITQEAVETLRELYPKVLADLTTNLMTRMAQASRPVPYEHRVALSILFDVALDPTMTPESIADFQATWAGQSKDPATRAAQGGRGAQMSQSTLGQNVQTPVDRLMAGG